MKQIKVCAHNPSLPEFSLCGMAFDSPDTEDDVEPFELADECHRNVTCPICKKALKELFETYTKTGRLK